MSRAISRRSPALSAMALPRSCRGLKKKEGVRVKGYCELNNIIVTNTTQAMSYRLFFVFGLKYSATLFHTRIQLTVT
jgi:hypothetical protein